MKTNVVIFGKNGQVGSSLVALFTTERTFAVQGYSSKDIDFTDLSALESFLKNLSSKPDFIINAVAYTNVDKAEDEQELADLINHLAVKIIAKYCQKNNIKLIHYSTDYVFDGSGITPFTEDNIENLKPLNHYGKTKLAGEEAIIKSGCDYIIFRLSWVYDKNPLHRNFLNIIKKLAKENKVLNVVDDQIGSPTSADFVAQNTLLMIKKLLPLGGDFPGGIYHLNNGEFVSWYDFAIKIIEELRRERVVLKIQQIEPIKTPQYKTKATRPLNSRLLNYKLQKFFNKK